MNTLQTCGVLAALSLASAAFAQTQDRPSTSSTPSTTQTQGATAPSTSPTEGTAADRTAPGETPTRQMGEADTSGMTTGPQPSTSPTEGTAADSTPPGKTPTTSDTASTSQASSEMVGATVVSSDQSELGKVVDVVFDAKGQPEFVVVSTEQGKAAAIPYQTATQMKSGNKVVIDESRLQRAPTVKEGEWRGRSETWKDDSSRYWSKG